MTTWLRIFAERLLNSLWFVPALMALAAALLALVCAGLDRTVSGGSSGSGFALLYRGDVESARTVLSTIAGSMITVAGVSFSVTMVALSLASSQLGPRLLMNFMRDHGNQVVLGGFIGTFLFCLLALGSTTSASGQVVSVSVSVALCMAVGSLLLLIFFIHHIATSMQADQVICNVASELDRGLQRLFDDERDTPRPDELGCTGECDATASAPVKGYLQGVDEAGLLELANDHDLRLRVLRRPGHYVAQGSPLVKVWGGSGVDDALVERIGRGFLIGGNRTPDQDLEYGVHQLVEIAVRALSPGVNDPFTAMTCVDHLSGILAGVASRRARSALRRDDSGTARLALDPIDFAEVFNAGFNQIRQSSRGMPSVAVRMLEGLATIAAATSDRERLEAIVAQGRMVYQAHAEALQTADLEALEDRWHCLQRQAAADGTD